ncbi:phenylalanine--tRNA ligase subunit alpha [Alphaproteobacteria bacterium]|nr:phenylalanine--tRNA ligase subunit alpha [Alphaproteobacteria bacterium]
MVDQLQEKLIKLSDEIRELISKASDLKSLDEIRINSLGKKGSITSHLKNLRDYDNDSKIKIGSLVNKIKTNINDLIENKILFFKKDILDQRIKNDKIDVTLTSQDRDLGTLHPLSRTIDELSAIFADMGFSIVDGPDIETDYYNFTALNIPQEHPARQEHDTFYLKPDEEGKRKVLRTHTSPVQIRTMEKLKLNEFDEIRYIIPGRTYRSDHDATHSPMFHQCEGLVLGKNINMGHLKGCLIEFCRSYFNENDLPVRFRPSYFPFTEPSAEVDIGCRKEKDGSLSIGEGEDWLEILGSGMVHPRVLQGVGIDPNIYQGFAFGMGLERLTMLKYGIPDLRPFYDSDLRWLKHYGFIPVDNPSLHSGLNGIFS